MCIAVIHIAINNIATPKDIEVLIIKSHFLMRVIFILVTHEFFKISVNYKLLERALIGK